MSAASARTGASGTRGIPTQRSPGRRCPPGWHQRRHHGTSGCRRRTPPTGHRARPPRPTAPRTACMHPPQPPQLRAPPPWPPPSPPVEQQEWNFIRPTSSVNSTQLYLASCLYYYSDRIAEYHLGSKAHCHRPRPWRCKRDMSGSTWKTVPCKPNPANATC